LRDLDVGPGRYILELPEQGDPAIGQELIRVHYADGQTEEVRLHDYGRVYSIAGLYEQIVHDRLGCRSPEQIAAMLAAAVDRLGWERDAVRVIDLAAGNGISGAALAVQGLHPVMGTDIVASARQAALRDRPGVYDAYETLDLLDLGPAQQRAIADLDANALACVAPVGTASQQLPPLALTAVARLLAPDALIAYMHDPELGVPDELTPQLMREQLGASARIEQLERRRYLHRYTIGGRPYEMDGVILRVSYEAQ
jgi:hypothetical protein